MTPRIHPRRRLSGRVPGAGQCGCVSHIAWESEVWIAEDPGHRIHFIGGQGVCPKAPIKTGETQRMKESYHESLANHMSPESCLDGPQGRGEALTGGNTGVVLSSENTLSRRPSQWAGAKATRLTALCESLNAPAESLDHRMCGRVSRGNRETPERRSA